MLDFVVGVAGTVLSNVITELVTGRKKAAQVEEIKLEVTRQLAQHTKLQNEQLAQALKLTLEEMMRLVDHVSGLKLSDDRIELKRPFEIPFISPKRDTDEELRKQLEQLNMAVLSRREELHLPLLPVEVPPESAVPPKNDAHSSSVEWKQVRKQDVDSPTAQEIKKMQERIYRRRLGEVPPHE